MVHAWEELQQGGGHGRPWTVGALALRLGEDQAQGQCSLEKALTEVQVNSTQAVTQGARTDLWSTGGLVSYSKLREGLAWPLRCWTRGDSGQHTEGVLL